MLQPILIELLRLEPIPAVYKPRCKNIVNPQIGFLEVWLCFGSFLGCLFEVGVYMHANIFIWDWMSIFFLLFHAWYTLAFMRIPTLIRSLHAKLSKRFPNKHFEQILLISAICCQCFPVISVVFNAPMFTFSKCFQPNLRLFLLRIYYASRVQVGTSGVLE